MITVAGVSFEEMNFLMGLLACTAVVGVAVAKDKNHKQSVVVSWLAQYTMPIFLMHSIFAATLQSVLLKVGRTSAWVNILTCQYYRTGCRSDCHEETEISRFFTVSK